MGAFSDMIAARRKKNCSKGSLLVAIGASSIKNNLDYEAFRLLSSWLGIYSYIPPSDRDIDFDLMSYLLRGVAAQVASSKENATRRIFRAYLIMDMMETCFNEEQQSQVVALLTKGEVVANGECLMSEI